MFIQMYKRYLDEKRENCAKWALTD